jgi:tRNA-specific 2-thiouridylase
MMPGVSARRSAFPTTFSTTKSVFQEAVINPFAESYVAGETPIPCVACNQTVKFADLLATARDLGADALATGHYIRSRANPSPGNPGRRALYRPVDSDRDQSYFLFATTQEQLDYVRFPLGELPKIRTRELAEEMGLIVADKADSQDICFVPQGQIRQCDHQAQAECGAGRRHRPY